jgi:DsbC/DsbD-like thiol-disulfide interchange protein
MKRSVIAFALALAVLAPPAHAAMTGWTEVQGGAVRLIASGPMKDGHYEAGLEFMLEPGWHTYWRYPGEAGIPPQIDTSASANLKSKEVLFPVPERYDDGFSESIVYHNGIVLPLRIEPEAPDQPVTLSLDVFFGICNEICVPGDATLTLDLAPDGEADSLAQMLIARDLDAVPDAAPSEDLQIKSVTLSADGDALDIEVQAPENASPDLFAAAPEGSYIGLPKHTGQSSGSHVWRLSLKGMKTTDSDTELRLVLSSDGRAVEQLFPIDPDWLN